MGIAVALVGYRYEPQVQRHVEWLYWSYRCEQYTARQGLERFVTDPTQVKSLSSDPDYLVDNKWAFYSPYAFRQLKNLDGRCNWLGDPPSSPLAFLGTRNRPDGTSRLVAISGSMDNAYDLFGDMSVLVLPRPGPFQPIPEEAAGHGYAYDGPALRIDVQAGLPDPKDAAHITFAFVCYQLPRYASGGLLKTGGTIDAYLRNDDSVEFSGHTTNGATLEWARGKISGLIPQDYLHNGISYLTGRG
jgi:hypothetical protein